MDGRVFSGEEKTDCFTQEVSLVWTGSCEKSKTTLQAPLEFEHSPRHCTAMFLVRAMGEPYYLSLSTANVHKRHLTNDTLLIATCPQSHILSFGDPFFGYPSCGPSHSTAFFE